MPIITKIMIFPFFYLACNKKNLGAIQLQELCVKDYKKIFPVEKLATPSENSALLVSSYLDAKLKQKNISKEDKVYANTAIKIFDAIGEIMEFMDQDNQAAHEYRERYMADMRTLANYIFQKESK